jgi:hypothetical protein
MRIVPRTLVAAALCLACGVAFAQLRTIPPQAKRAEMRHVQELLVELNGERAQLAPGAQIRDASNRLVLPAALPPGSLVKYLRDAQGYVFRVWILTPEEAAQPDPAN